ncbi:MAG: cyclic nucleotide-binding domain-containing protein [Oceanospirillaceae bacterium]|nr:cyclic nucleotide-binding domain-containing protein [Oceanospirillaceae bacterium]
MPETDTRPPPAPERLEPTLMRFIWRYSAPQQLILLAITLLSFPVLYASLELPKRILNEAIGGTLFPVTLFGIDFNQLQLLLTLCALFLFTLLLNGLIKMRLNIYKGMVGERLLRRLRYRLVTHIMRFPTNRFRRMSQGEVVSMITAEVEPLSGIMGDALANPLFQAGQMLTILTFLFVQNPWFGLAGVAMVPLQAIITPMLQRRINRLHRERVKRVRKLSELIGESVQGLEDLRVNGGLPYAMALFSHRLGGLFWVRADIFRKKFFMKFLNNFINNLPPFFFYSVGGYLVIQGELSVGALVAAISANKDILAPWRELLSYISQIQETSDRYISLRDQFEPDDLLPARLFDGQPQAIPRLQGDIRLEGVGVIDSNGSSLLSDINLDIPAGKLVAIESQSAPVRRAFAQALSRSIAVSTGRIEIAGHDLGDLHQSVIAARIGMATGTPYLFNASVGENVFMSLRGDPRTEAPDPNTRDPELREALLSGNSTYPVNAEWLDLARAGFTSQEEMRQWWLQLIELMGSETYLLQRSLDSRFDPSDRPDFAQELVSLRHIVRQRLEAENLQGYVHLFDRNRMNPALTLGENLLFATQEYAGSAEQEASFQLLIDWLIDSGYGLELAQYAESLLENLIETFASVGPLHPLFKRLGKLTTDQYQALEALYHRLQSGRTLNARDRRLWLSLPFIVAPELLDIAPAKGISAAVLALREDCIAQFGEKLKPHFRPLDPDAINPSLGVLENLLFGRLARAGEAREKQIRSLVADAVQQAGLQAKLWLLIRSLPAGIGGSELPPTSRERFGFVRAVVKRPDILILEQALATHDAMLRNATLKSLRRLLPETTILVLEPSFQDTSEYDLVVRLKDGRLHLDEAVAAQRASEGGTDFVRKHRVIAGTGVFTHLSSGQIRLLAYASRWVQVDAGEYLFRAGDFPDGAYILAEGIAQMRWPGAAPDTPSVTDVGPGRLIGDLSVILDKPRSMDLVAVRPVLALRLERRELMQIIENDVLVATTLLRTVADHLYEASEMIRVERYEEL